MSQHFRIATQRIAIGLCAALACAALAGFLPGESILLGALGSEPLIDVARAFGAVLIGLAARNGSARMLQSALRVAGCGALLLSVLVTADLLAGTSSMPSTRPGDIAAGLAVAATSLTTAQVIRRGRQGYRPDDGDADGHNGAGLGRAA
jgi:hypothetical protein